MVMVGGFPLPAYRARAARKPAPRIPNATSGRAAASGSSVAVAVEVARAEVEAMGESESESESLEVSGSSEGLAFHVKTAPSLLTVKI